MLNFDNKAMDDGLMLISACSLPSSGSLESAHTLYPRSFTSFKPRCCVCRAHPKGKELLRGEMRCWTTARVLELWKRAGAIQTCPLGSHLPSQTEGMEAILLIQVRFTLNLLVKCFVGRAVGNSCPSNLRRNSPSQRGQTAMDTRHRRMGKGQGSVFVLLLHTASSEMCPWLQVKLEQFWVLCPWWNKLDKFSVLDSGVWHKQWGET